jgi:hypothetical protein
LTEAFQKTDRKSPAGRKPLDVILMFKAIVIQGFFNLSDEQLEFQITDPLLLLGFWDCMTARRSLTTQVSGALGSL